MTARNKGIHAVSDVSEIKKVRVRVLGTGSRSKSKRQSPPSSGHIGSSTNVLATHSKRRRRVAQRIIIKITSHIHVQTTTNCFLTTGMFSPVHVKRWSWWRKQNDIIWILLEFLLLRDMVLELQIWMAGESYSLLVLIQKCLLMRVLV